MQNFIVSDNLSNQTINSIMQDEMGYLWIGTDRGLNRYNGYDYHQYLNDKNNPNSLCNNNVTAIFEDKNNNLWLGTINGISKFDTRTRTFDRIPIKSTQSLVQQILSTYDGSIFANLNDGIYKFEPAEGQFNLAIKFQSDNVLNRFFIDEQDRFWLISKYSIDCYSYPDFNKITETSIKTKPNLFFGDMLPNGFLWVIHDKGNFHIFDTKNNKAIAVPEAISAHPILSKAIVIKVFQSGKGRFLFCTHKNGNFLYLADEQRVVSEQESEFPFLMPNVIITTIFRDDAKNIWVGSEEQGLFPFYKDERIFNNIKLLSTFTKEMSIKALTFDNKGQLWMSSLSEDLYVYDIKTGRINTISLLELFPEAPYFMDQIIDLISDKQNIYILTKSKVIRCTYSDGRLSRKDSFNMRRELTKFTLDSEGKFWISTTKDDVVIIDFDKQTEETLSVFNAGVRNNSTLLSLSNGNILVAASNQPLKTINPLTREVKILQLKNKPTFNNFEPSSLLEDSNKLIWIGNYNGPLLKYDPQNEEIDTIGINNVSSIIADSDNNIWTGTLYGLGYYQTNKDKCNIYYSYDGIGGNQFNNHAVIMPDGSLAFGATHGITIFSPKEITNTGASPLYIEDVQINNGPLLSYQRITNNSYLFKDSTLTLDYNQNALNISYAALEFSESSKTRYFYRLQKYDDQWIEANRSRVAHYTNLKPGNYTFQIRATSNDNVSVKGETALRIHISNPPWLKAWAIILYIILIGSVGYYIYLLYTRNRESKISAMMAIRDKESEAMVNRMNMSFFSNISHEFRTPLTLIIGPLSSLNKSDSFNENQKSLIHLIQRNTKRMLRLVNQLMDLNKLEADTLKLKVNRVDAIHQVNSILDLYQPLAAEKNITFRAVGLEGSYFMMIDVDKLEKIITNILSNAFKYTPEGGSITVYFDVETRKELDSRFPGINSNYAGYYAHIEIEDTGIGIPEDKLENIFKRYYQIDDKQNEQHRWGTGIGLYFTRRLVEIHHGMIKAVNNKFGGSKFSFILPAEKNAYQENEIYRKENFILTDLEKLESLQEASLSAEPAILNDPNVAKKTILIVEDDLEIAYYIKKLLIPHYSVFTKYDGESAWRNLSKINPDLIISDVLMPIMNGYELCTKMKGNLDYCHIPVILLTAKTLLEEKVKGLENGANAYVTKPFESAYLIAVVKSQLKNRELLGEILNSKTDTSLVKEEMMSPKDQAFMKQLYELMATELANPEINVTAIAEKMKMSRTKFYHKIKGLTNEQPSVFFKKYKLNKAAELIITGQYNVTEISEMTGFVSLAHFSKSFKKQFNCNASEYKGL